MADSPGTAEAGETDPDSHAALLDRSRAYAKTVVAETDLSVDLDRVSWEVSTRAKRRAAAVKYPRVEGATVGEPVDWESVAVDDAQYRPADATSAADAPEGPAWCTVSLTWRAARAFDPGEWQSTLRHELIHVAQFQRFGTTDHGAAFKRHAAEIGTDTTCQVFTTPKYRLDCAECGAVVARRYRDCKLVRRYDEYESGCCGAPLSLTEPAGEESAGD